MQLRNHSLREFSDLAPAFNRRLCQKCFRFRPIEARMHTGHVFEQLRNANPARQHGHICYESDFAHEFVAFGPRIATKHFQFSVVRGEPENSIERRCLACAVRADDSDNAALFDMQIDAVQRYSRAEHLAKAACFYRRHG